MGWAPPSRFSMRGIVWGCFVGCCRLRKAAGGFVGRGYAGLNRAFWAPDFSGASCGNASRHCRAGGNPNGSLPGLLPARRWRGAVGDGVIRGGINQIKNSVKYDFGWVVARSLVGLHVGEKKDRPEGRSCVDELLQATRAACGLSLSYDGVAPGRRGRSVPAKQAQGWGGTRP